MNASPDSSPERSRCVLTEVEAVVAEDAFEEEGELDVLEVAAGRRVLIRTRRFSGSAHRRH
jgi:hypothetical protein